MTSYLVTNTQFGANLRAQPSTAGDPIELLPFGTALTEIAPSPTKWKQVHVAGDPARSGFVSDVNLTVARSDAIRRLIGAAAFYWDLFDRGRGKEDVQPFKGFVLQMWDDLPHPRPPHDDTSDPDFPWSAAGMSAFIRRAGGYDGFRFSAGHATYIHDAIVKRQQNRPAPFWGFRITERKPEVGDLIGQWRVRRIGFDDAAAGDGFKSHTDVVCEVRDGYLWTLGANVGPDLVARKKYALTADGHLAGTSKEIVVMQNRAA